MLRNKYGAKTIAFLSKWLIRSILFTCRFRIEGIEKFNHVSKEKKCILMVWHNRLALVAEILHRYAPQNQYAAVVSNSKDAEPLALLASSYKGKTIRVSHDARCQALRRMAYHLKQGKDVVIITPDGPRGPRYEVKPGIAVAAKYSSALIFPLSWSASHFWQFGTWDKMILPKPFSIIMIMVGESVQLSKEDPDLSYATNLLEKNLSETMYKACQALSSDPKKWPV